MKQLFYTLLAVVLLSAMPAAAQWQASDAQAVRLDGNNKGQSLLRSIRTADGNIILSWVRYERTDQADETSGGYHLYMQVFNADGTQRFGQNGLCVSNQRTSSYTTDYSLALAPNGDILLAYWDARDDATLDHINAYIYRYTQAGQAVWGAEGIRVPVYGAASTLFAEDSSPQWCVSGENIYLALYHTEAADENSEQVSNCQLLRIADDGTCAWDAPIVTGYRTLLMQPCVDGDAYVVYCTDGLHLLGQRLRADGTFAWAQEVALGEEKISTGFYVPQPKGVTDANGDLLLTYRVLADWSGYQVINRLTKDGQVLAQAVSCNNSDEGDADMYSFATKGQSIFVAWDYTTVNNQRQLMTNLLGSDGVFLWAADKQYGQAIATNASWGFEPMAVLPQTNGWVVLYDDCTGWNTANMMMAKLTDAGELLWSKQLAQADMVVESVTAAHDADNAYIFYVLESAGMYALCTNITDAHNTGIETVNSQPAAVSKRIENGHLIVVRDNRRYTALGVQVQ